MGGDVFKNVALYMVAVTDGFACCAFISRVEREVLKTSPPYKALARKTARDSKAWNSNSKAWN